MRMTLVLAHPTRKGVVFIGRSSDGRYHPIWKDESLGSYVNAPQAIDDVAGGHTFSPSDGTDMGSLGLSSDIGDWQDPRDFL